MPPPSKKVAAARRAGLIATEKRAADTSNTTPAKKAKKATEILPGALKQAGWRLRTGSLVSQTGRPLQSPGKDGKGRGRVYHRGWFWR